MTAQFSLIRGRTGGHRPPLQLFGSASRDFKSQRGQVAVELAIQIPLMLLLMFGAVQIGRIFYTYHSLQKAVRGGAGMLARATNVNYCDSNDVTMQDARNFVVYGNLQGVGTPVVTGLTTDMIEILPERQAAGDTAVTACLCLVADPEGCDRTAGGRVPEFVVVRLLSGYPLNLAFPTVDVGEITLQVSVRMPVTGN